MHDSAPIRIGTRGSSLARWQAQWVADALMARGHAVQLVPIVTRGDVYAHSPIGEIGTAGVFTKEIQRALLDGRIDVAVHSLKDLPTETVKGLTLAAIPERESPFDALICRDSRPLDALGLAARVGTGSLRRQSQLLHVRRDLQMAPIRGNVETRLQKLADGQFDALVLAEAGLKRLGLSDHIAQILSPPLFLPAVGQGALGLEVRADSEVCTTVQNLDNPASHAAVLAERALLAAVGGGCLAPIGAWGRIDDTGQLVLDAVVLSRDGALRVEGSSQGNPAHPVAVGEVVAQQLLDQGAAELIQESRRGTSA